MLNECITCGTNQGSEELFIIKQCKSDNIQIGFTLGESVAGSCP